MKKLDPYKKALLDFVDLLPLDQIEFDIQTSKDPLIKEFYNNLVDGTQLVDKHRYRGIYHKLGILFIYGLFDPCYSDFIRWMLKQSEGVDPQARDPKSWRVNNLHDDSV